MNRATCREVKAITARLAASVVFFLLVALLSCGGTNPGALLEEGNLFGACQLLNEQRAEGEDDWDAQGRLADLLEKASDLRISVRAVSQEELSSKVGAPVVLENGVSHWFYVFRVMLEVNQLAEGVRVEMEPPSVTGHLLHWERPVDSLDAFIPRKMAKRRVTSTSPPVTGKTILEAVVTGGMSLIPGIEKSLRKRRPSPEERARQEEKARQEAEAEQRQLDADRVNALSKLDTLLTSSCHEASPGQLVLESGDRCEWTQIVRYRSDRAGRDDALVRVPLYFVLQHAGSTCRWDGTEYIQLPSDRTMEAGLADLFPQGPRPLRDLSQRDWSR